MKHIVIIGLALSLTALSTSTLAGEVIAETTDRTAGGALGATTGVMIGAIGGPLGALVGGGVGLLLGKGVQQAAGLEERAYTVRTDAGETQVVRSPNAEFAIGQQVERRGNRLQAATGPGR